ncbi:unnamed protein product [Withania somnifera]
MDLNLKLERKTSIRKLGRSRSTLLATELIIPCGDSAYYERISQSMRHAEIIDDNETISIIRDNWRKRKNKAWVFLMRVFSFKKLKIATNDEKISEKESVGAVVKSMEVVDHMNKKKMKTSSWEMSQKPDEALVVEKKKIGKPIFLPDPYRRWPVQGWRF